MTMKMNFRRMGVAALVAGAVCASMTTTNAAGVPITSLIGGGAVTNTLANLEFSNFSLTITKTVGGTPVDTSSLLAATMIDPNFMSVSGIDITFAPQMGANSTEDFKLGYTVTPLTPGVKLGEFACNMGGYSVTGATSSIHMQEDIYSDASLIHTVDSGDFWIYDNTLSSQQYIDVALPTSLDAAFVVKDISFSTDSSAGAAIGGSEIIQNFPIPEPTSAALIVLLGGGLIGWRRMRRFSRN